MIQNVGKSHQVPTKSYTDEELSSLIKETHKSMGVNNCSTFDFIKAFLKKAQEKQ